MSLEGCSSYLFSLLVLTLGRSPIEARDDKIAVIAQNSEV
jgi:hypothetical protein